MSPSLPPIPSRPALPLRALVHLALTYAVAINGLILTPFIIGAVSRRFGLSDGAATQTAGFEIIAIAVACAVMPRWVHRLAGTYARVGVAGTLVAQLASAFAPNVQTLVIARGLAGLFEGLLFVVVSAALARRADTDRLWGVVILMAGVLDGFVLVGIAYLPEQQLSRWLFLVLAALIAVTAPASVDSGRHADRDGARGPARRTPWRLVLACWGVLLLLYGVQSAQWAVAGIVGTRIGLSGPTVGLLLSVSSLVGFAGAAIPALQGAHRYRLPLVWLAQIASAAALLLFFDAHDATGYFGSQSLLNVALFAAIPFLTGRLSQLDSDGSLVAHTVVVTFLGAGVGTALAGDGFNAAGSARFAAWACAGALAGAPLAWFALRTAGVPPRPGVHRHD